MIAKITGEAAMNILAELENGRGIHFRCVFDDQGYPVVELHKEKWYMENMPSDKKEQNQASI